MPKLAFKRFLNNRSFVVACTRDRSVFRLIVGIENTEWAFL